MSPLQLSSGQKVARKLSMERRGATRFGLRLPVTFSWTDENGVTLSNEGQSRDLNSRGIYVYSILCPPLAAQIMMDVFLPRPLSSTRPVELHAEGRVVRCDAEESSPETKGFAVMNHTAMLRDSSGRIVNERDAWNSFGPGRTDKG